MKSDKKKLVEAISEAILSHLGGLDKKSAKKLIKVVDDASEDVVKKFSKLQSEEEDDKDRDAKKAEDKKAKAIKKAQKEKAKAAEKAAKAVKIAIVTKGGKVDYSKVESLPVPRPSTAAKTVAKKAPVAAKTVAKPATRTRAKKVVSTEDGEPLPF
jgi:hypothetical protein